MRAYKWMDAYNIISVEAPEGVWFTQAKVMVRISGPLALLTSWVVRLRLVKLIHCRFQWVEISDLPMAGQKGEPDIEPKS